jgi:hypothetical protein
MEPLQVQSIVVSGEDEVIEEKEQWKSVKQTQKTGSGAGAGAGAVKSCD